MAFLGITKLGRDFRRYGAVALTCAAAVLVGALVSPSTADAQSARLEYAVKANYLYKFGPFVGWPPQVFTSRATPFTVCVLGSDPFGAMLDEAVRGQSVQGHPVTVRRLQTISKSPPCHVLYIGRSHPQTRSEVFQLLSGSPVLTVTDERGGGGGGIVHFVIRQGRVRFGVDARRAQASGLTISSKLLELAVPVQQGGGS